MKGGDTILTYQDMLLETNTQAFILKAIREYKKSDMYRNAQTAQYYYSTDNEAIGGRLGFLERQMRSMVNITFHRLRNGFFPKAVKRLVLYLMGNGATLDDGIKEQIDRKFDNTMIYATVNACVDGVVWGFPDLDGLTFFRATEFVPLFDERTNNLMAGIRFWQIDKEKPIYIEFYEIDGITEFEADKHGTNIRETLPKRPYVQTVQQDAISTTVINGENYGVLPIFSLYANELGESELTTGLKALIDAYDFVSSDWVDNTTLIEGLYGIIKNYGGQDASTLLAEIQQLKVIVEDGSDAGAELQSIEMPYASRQALLDFLEARMYDDFLLPDKRRQGSTVTATEIRDAREDMDIKADMLEWQVAEFIERVLLLKGHDELLANYKRRTTNNDTETVQNIATSVSGEWRDITQAIKDDPTIPTEDKDELIQRIQLRDAELDNMRFPQGEEVTDDAESSTQTDN